MNLSLVVHSLDTQNLNMDYLDYKYYVLVMNIFLWWVKMFYYFVMKRNHIVYQGKNYGKVLKALPITKLGKKLVPDDMRVDIYGIGFDNGFSVEFRENVTREMEGGTSCSSTGKESTIGFYKVTEAVNLPISDLERLISALQTEQKRKKA